MGRMIKFAAIAALCSFSWTSRCGAHQSRGIASAPPPYLSSAQLAALRPAPRPGDVSSPQALLAALYASVSGHFTSLDWSRLRSLFLPGARVGMGRSGPFGQISVQFVSADQNINFLQSLSPTIINKEAVLKAHIDKFGDVASAFYISTETMKDGGKTETHTGVNTVAMLSDGRRWWVACIIFGNRLGSDKLPEDLTH